MWLLRRLEVVNKCNNNNHRNMFGGRSHTFGTDPRTSCSLVGYEARVHEKRVGELYCKRNESPCHYPDLMV